MNIDLVPDIKNQPQIYRAHKTGKLVLFVGAGASAIWGCHRWEDLAVKLIDDCFEKEKINFWAKKSLIAKYSGSPRRLITIAKEMLGPDYLSCLKNRLNSIPDRKEKYSLLFKNLADLNAAIITTNIDDNLACCFHKKDIHVGVDRFGSSISSKKLYQLHGLMGHDDSLVMTIDEYINQYRHPNIQAFLKHVFTEEDYCLLFLGYGMGDLEIIDYMMEKYKEETRRLFNRYYILLPYFNQEKGLLRHEEAYFKQINMTIVPYQLDERGYDQLHEVIATWKKELTAENRNDEFYKFTDLIDKNL